MRTGIVAIGAGLLVSFFSFVSFGMWAGPARGQADDVDPRAERIGRYEIVAVPEGTEIRTPVRRDVSAALVAVGIACLIAALWVSDRVPRPILPALLLMGVALIALGGLGAWARTRFVVTDNELVREDSFGSPSRVRLEEIESIGVGRARPKGTDLKMRSQLRPFEVRVWRRGGGTAARFRFAAPAEADRMAARLAELLHVSAPPTEADPD